jgi:hypothetical protein
VTSDQAQIQTLIDGIDEALNQTNPRLPWVMSNDAAQQRQVLEQTRQYLTSLQQQTEADRPLPAVESPSQLSPSQLSSQSPQPSSESAQQVLQAVLQEMNYWRVNMLQPLRTEIDSLQRQREMLTQEIRQLENRRQQHNLGAQPNQQLLMEFLQSAMAQMQANLSGQVTQMIASQMQTGQPALSGSASLTPAERLAQMQTAQTQSDQLMLKLDSTLQVIFESLNRNVQTYEESLEQGLNRMHSLGQQGEAMFAFLVNRLAQQLGREASTFLQASTPNNWQSSSSLPAPSQESPATEPVSTSDFLSQIPESSQATFVPAIPFDLSEEVLDISELELLDQPDLDQPDQPFDQSLNQPLDNALEGLDLELSQLDLSAIPAIEPEAPSLDLFAGNQPLPVAPVPNIGRLEEPTSTASPIVNDLDSALDLLNQLSAEMQANLGQTDLEMEAESAPAQPPALSSETEFITVPDTLYDDAFYSMTDLETPSSGVEPTANTTDAPPLDAMTLEQAWFDGLGDPAADSPPEPTSEPTPQPDFNSSVSQSLETFLLSNSAPTVADPDLFAEFAEPLPSQPTSDLEPAVEAPTEMITSLTDLIPASDADVDSEPEPLEALPIAEAPIENFGVDLGSDADMLAQLDADLAQFGSSATSPEPTETAWDLFALPDDDTSPDPIAPSEPDPNPPNVTIEGLEDLFADLPAAENSPKIEATPDLFAQLKAAFSQDSGTPLETEQPIFLQYLDSDSADTDASDSEKKK